MPYYRRRRTTGIGRKRYAAKRRVVKVKSFRSVRPRRAILPSSGFPAKKLVRMRYCTTITLVSATNNLAYWNFRANSIFDPDATGTGHQPYSHDLWNQIYNHYRVVGSKIRVQFLGTQGTTNSICGVDLSDDGTITTDYDVLREMPGSKYRVITTQKPTTITRNFSAKKMFPNNVTQINAPFGSNPTEDAMFTAYVLAPTETGVVPAVSAVVDIDFICLLWELRELGRS